MQSSQAPTRTTMRRTIKRSFLLCASLVITPPKHTNTNISSSSVNTVHMQLQHISHASTGKQHHSSHTCLIARLTLVLPLPPHATSPSFLLPFSKTIGTRRTTVLTDFERNCTGYFQVPTWAHSPVQGNVHMKKKDVKMHMRTTEQLSWKTGNCI